MSLTAETTNWLRDDSSSNQVHSLSQDTNAESGTSSEMAVWSEDDDTIRLSLFVRGTGNQSAYSTPAGMVDAPSTLTKGGTMLRGPRDNPSGMEGDMAQDTNAEAGASSAMGVWEEDDFTVRTTLFRAGPSADTSYEAPHGLVDTARDSRFANPWLRGPAATGLESEAEAVQDDDAEAGDSDLLSAWFAKRSRKMQLVRGATGNEAAQGEPPGLMSLSPNWLRKSDDTNQEFGLGYGFPGHGLTPDGRPLAGSVELLADGDPVGGANAAGNFWASIGPIEGWGVEEGADGSGLPDQIDTEYRPDGDAIPIDRTDEPFPKPDFLDAAYSAVAGQIVDVDGDPIEGALVEVPEYDRGASTDENGIYELFAPQGTEINLEALDGTATGSATPAALETVYVHFQYGGIKVEVRDATGSPVPNTPVEWNDTEYRTDETGNVRITEASIDTHELTIFDAKTVEIAVGEQGHLATHRESGDGASLKIIVRDDRTGRRIAETKALELTQEAVTYTDDNGELRTVAIADVAEDPDNHEFDVVVGVDDPRYRTKRVTVQADADENQIEETVHLDPDVTITRT